MLRVVEGPCQNPIVLKEKVWVVLDGNGRVLATCHSEQEADKIVHERLHSESSEIERIVGRR